MQSESQIQNSVVDLRSVTKRYGHVTAVDNVSLTVSEGEFITLLGPSGSGKTTVLRMIAGFLQPSSGEIYVHGESVSNKAPYERKIGMVFQSLALFPHLDVYGNVSFALKCVVLTRRKFRTGLIAFWKLYDCRRCGIAKFINSAAGSSSESP